MRVPAAYFLLFTAALTGCASPDGASRGRIEVKTMTVSPSEIRRTVEFSALLEPRSEAFLVSPGGVFTLIAVNEGDSVRAGETIAVLSGDAALSGALAAAEEDLREAMTSAAHAANNEVRTAALYEAGAASEAVLLGARAASTASEAAVDGARFARAAALAQARSGLLRAPFDGVVGMVRGRCGMLSSPGEIVASVTGDGLMARLLLPERHLLEITPGMPAFFHPSLTEYPSLEGTVESVALSVDPLTGLVPVTVLFDPVENTRVRPGVSGVLTIELARAGSAAVIPAGAVVMAAGGMQVPVLGEDGHVDIRSVELGIQSGDSIQVTDGIAFGEEVILWSSEPLSQGVRAARAGY